MNGWHIFWGIVTLLIAYLIWRNRPRTEEDLANEAAEREYREWRDGEAARFLREMEEDRRGKS